MNPVNQEGISAVTMHPSALRSSSTSAQAARAITIAVCILVLSAFALPATANYDELSVTFFYVGPGNCVLIQCPTSSGTDYVNLIVDCGSHRTREKASVLENLNAVLGEGWEGPEGIVTNLVLTHPDKDHYNYIKDMTPLLKFPSGLVGDTVTYHEGNLGTVYAGGVFADYSKEGLLYDAIQYSAGSDIYGQKQPYELGPIVLASSNKMRPYKTRRYLRDLREVQSLRFDPAAIPTDLGLCGDAEVFLLSGNSSPAAIQTNTNAQSLVLALRYGGKVFIFPGDATNEQAHGNGLQTALDSWARLHGKTLSSYSTFDAELKVDFLMAPHHGAKTEGSDWNGWAEVTRPEVVIFSADPELTGYHHPSQSAFEAYLPHLKSTKSPIPFTYWRESGGGYTKETSVVEKAAIGLANSGDFVVNVDSTGGVAIQCSGDRAEAWGCGTALLESIVPEDDEPAHRRLVAESNVLDESFESPTVPTGSTLPSEAPVDWIHCQGGGLAHESTLSQGTPFGSQVLYIDGTTATKRGALPAITAEHSYLVAADLMAEATGAGSGSGSVSLELVALSFGEQVEAACEPSNVVASLPITLSSGAGWQSHRFIFTADVDHLEISKDLAVRIRRTDSNTTVVVYADRVRMVETRSMDESFESPIVEGYVPEALPAAGWVGCGTTSLGLHNEQNGASFETPHGRQAIELGGSYSGITTQENLIGSLTDGQVYTVSFESRTVSSSGTQYHAELVAFSEGQGNEARTECVNRPGTVLAAIRGTITASEGWKTISLSYVPNAGDPELSADVGLRLINENGAPILLDNVRLTVGSATTQE